MPVVKLTQHERLWAMTGEEPVYGCYRVVADAADPERYPGRYWCQPEWPGVTYGELMTREPFDPPPLKERYFERARGPHGLHWVEVER